MEPCTREMQHFLTDHDSQIQNASSFDHHHHHQPPAQEDFLETMMFSSLPVWGSGSGVDQAMKQSASCWDVLPASMSRAIVDESSHSDPAVGFPKHFQPGDDDESSGLASKLRQHQIGGGRTMMHHHQQIMMMPLSLGGGGGGDGHRNDAIDGSPPSSSFKSPNSHQRGGDGSVQALYNGFTAGSLHGGSAQPPTQTQHLHHPQGAQSFGAGGSVMNQSQGQVQAQPQGSASTSAGAAPAQPKARVRARRGQATDPHSIAERLRRERIAERMKALQELVPNANKTDKASMLDEIIDYVKFLQLQVKVLSVSRLGGAGAVGPRIADLSSEGGIDRLKAMGIRGGAGPLSRSSNGNPTASAAAAAGNNDSLTVTEHQVAKLMEEDMGSAMQYLQGKGLCLMPISLATAISTATSQSRHPLFNTTTTTSNQTNGPPPPAPPREGPSSPNMSVLTVQSATAGNGKADGGPVKDTPSASKS